MSDGSSGLDYGLTSLPIAAGDCWRRIGTAGDRSCPELETHIHCRNCPVFASAARTLFDRPAPEHYLAEWTQWLAGSPVTVSLEAGASAALSDRDRVSVLIFRLGREWMAFPTQAIAEVTVPRPIHRIPHRSNAILIGLVNLRGQLQLCISLHGLLGLESPQASSSQFHSRIKHRNRENRGNRIDPNLRLALDRPTQSRAFGKLDFRGRGGSRRSSASPLPDAQRLLDAGQSGSQLQSGDPLLGRSKRQFP